MSTILFILLLYSMPQDFLHPDYSEDLVVNARITNSGFTLMFPGKFYYLNLTVINNTDSVQTFYMYSCSWQESFIIDLETVSFLRQECPTNVPISVNLPPKDSLEFHTMLVAIPPAFENESFRIGLVILSETELIKPPIKGNPINIEEAEFLRRTYLLSRNIFWSNPISIKDRTLGYDLKKVLRWESN